MQKASGTAGSLGSNLLLVHLRSVILVCLSFKKSVVHAGWAVEWFRKYTAM